MANYTPFGVALAFQRNAIRQGQRTVEQGMEAQRTMAEAVIHNAIGMGRTTNRNATEATKQGMVTAAGMMDAMTPAGADTAATVEQGFDSVVDVQENAWQIFEKSVEDGLAAYEQFAESGMEVFSESVDVTVAAHEEVGRRSADAAVEYERQRPEDHATGGRGQREPDREEATPATAAAAESVTIEPEEASEPAVEGDESVVEAGEPVTEAGEPATGPGLEDLSGVGAAYAERLRAAGIDSVEALQDADVAELSAETEISDERLSNWQRQVRHMLDEAE